MEYVNSCINMTHKTLQSIHHRNEKAQQFPKHSERLPSFSFCLIKDHGIMDKAPLKRIPLKLDNCHLLIGIETLGQRRKRIVIEIPNNQSLGKSACNMIRQLRGLEAIKISLVIVIIYAHSYKTVQP